MTQWAEIRHLHLVEGVSKKQIARRLQLDIKTVRRAVEQPTPPVRASSPRVRSLDPWREQIAQWLDQDRRVTAKRIRRLLLPLAGPVAARTVRRYVAARRAATSPKEGYVHRSVRPGTTMEVDFGESWAEVAGMPRKVKYLVATLPYSNVYFAKAYPLERLESLLDGIESAFTYFGGVVDRVVLDNTSLAVKAVLAGRDRLETEAFAAFRGAYPFRAEFCAPAKGWEKGSVETGVKYVRNLVFRPRAATESWAALNALLITELEADLPTRHLDDGRSVQAAWMLERKHLRALPVHLPATCRVVARVADKFGHVRVDHETYSVPIRHAYRPVWVKLYHDRVAVAVGAEVVGAGGPAVGEALLRRQIGVFGEDPSGPLGRPPQAGDLSDGAGNGRHQRSTPPRSVSERSTRATVERQPAAERLVIGDVCGPTVRGSPRGVQGVVASPRSCGRAVSRFVRGRVSPAAASRAAPRPPRVSQAPHASVSES